MDVPRGRRDTLRVAADDSLSFFDFSTGKESIRGAVALYHGTRHPTTLHGGPP
jgi:hypothetical protein